MQTNADKALECRQNADKIRYYSLPGNGGNDNIEKRNMEEKWKAHPTRKNIFINKDDGLMYRKTKVGSFQMIAQKMTELQELESFRRMVGTVAVTSRTRRKVVPQSEQIPDENHT